MKHDTLAFFSKALTLTALALALAAGARAQEKIIDSFSNYDDGILPYGGVIGDSNGNLYGTTFLGGPNGGGAIFELSPSATGSWTKTALYSFSPGGTNAFSPVTNLVFDAQGNLYGIAISGGANGLGAIFELSPGSNGTWTERTLYSFPGGGDGNPAFPSALSIDSLGNLYGVTATGGVYGNGTVYELVAGLNGAWSKKILHSFSGNTDGGDPYGQRLALDASGNVYGEALIGGAHDYGVVFELVRGPSGDWTEKVLHAFSGASDGSASIGGPTLDAAGNLYGSSTYSVFELVTGSNGVWTEKILHTFAGGVDGANPESVLTFRVGKLYGTTFFGGNHHGTVFELTPGANGTWTEKTLHRFATTGGDGVSPYFAGLASDAQGNLYGTTPQGGTSNEGVVFEITP